MKNSFIEAGEKKASWWGSDFQWTTWLSSLHLEQSKGVVLNKDLAQKAIEVAEDLGLQGFAASPM